MACVEKHHAPQDEKKFPIEVSVVHIANSIATLAEIDSVSEGDAVRTEQFAWDKIGLSTEVIESTVRATQSQFTEMRDLLLG